MFTDDPEGATRQVDVQTSEGRDTCPLDVEDIIRALQGVWLAIKVECQIR